MNKVNPKHLTLFCALALFFFVFLEATLFFQTRMSHLSGPGTTLGQLPIQGASTIGLLAFPVVNRFVPEKRRILFVAAATVLGIISLIGVAGGPTPYSIVGAGMVSFLLIGLAGGAVYWATCAQSRSIMRFTTFIGASHALAMVAQIPFYGLTPNKIGEAIVLCVGITALSVLIIRSWPAASVLDAMKARRSKRPDKRIEEYPPIGWRLNHMTPPVAMALMLALVILCALLFNTLYNLTFDEYTTWTSQYTDITPRLVMAAGGLAAGILFDIKRARYLGITMFWISILAAAAVLGMQSGMPDYVGMATYFLASGAFMTFYTATFIWIAPHFRVPDFWSGMGRALNNLTAIAVGAPSLLVIQSNNPTAVTATLLPLLVGINALLFATGMMDLHPGRERDAAIDNAGAAGSADVAGGSGAAGGSAAAKSTGATSGAGAAGIAGAAGTTVTAGSGADVTNGTGGACSDGTGEEASVNQRNAIPHQQTPEERCAAFAERYQLTPREAEILAAVTADDRPLKQVATDLGVSLRTVQRHLTSLYNKTETQTRIGLTKLFWE